MLREHLFDRRAPADPLFRWRGGDVSRVEALSDAVFALTITLVVATTVVPSTFVDLWTVFLDAPVLAVCFTLLALLWHDHYRFYRRYGLEDAATTALNMVLLFLVLLYAFPLKFLFMFIWRALVLGTHRPEDIFPAMPEAAPFAELFADGYQQAVWMMILYGVGCAAVFVVLFLMHLRALGKREELGLDEIEVGLTRGSLRAHAISAGVALLSLAIVVVSDNVPVAGMTYVLNGPLHAWNGIATGRRAERLQEALGATSEPETDAAAEPDEA